MHDINHFTSNWPKVRYQVLQQLCRLPCLTSYAVGGTLGFMVGMCRRRLRERAAKNVAQSGCFGTDSAVRTALWVLFYAGVTVFDTLGLWFLPWSWCKHWVRTTGWEAVQALQKENPGRGIIFLTPHLGCFEMAGAWIGHQQSITSMYRPPRHAWLDRLMKWGRQRGNAHLVPAELAGVRALLKVLKQGGSIGILPDQVPQKGEGAWVPFFGRPAYTMTLIARMQKSTGACGVLVTAERRAWMGGIYLRFQIMPDEDPESSVEEAVHHMNKALEVAIARFPYQYLWGYNRYKVPTGVNPPQT